MGRQTDITLLLTEIEGGGAEAVESLMPLVYDELRGMAQRHMARERADHTLSSTALVHEAYLKLVDQTRVNWQNRAHFFAIAAQAMRRILINHAKARLAKKRGGGQPFVTLDESDLVGETREAEFVELDDALDRLALLDERQCRIVECRFFAGLTHEEIAEVLGVSEPTVRRDWRLARAWLSRELG